MARSPGGQAIGMQRLTLIIGGRADTRHDLDPPGGTPVSGVLGTAAVGRWLSLQPG